MMIMMMMAVMMIHNEIKERSDGEMEFHKVKNVNEKIMNMMVIMMAMTALVTMIILRMTMTTMEIRPCDRMGDWRSYSDQKVVELRRFS